MSHENVKMNTENSLSLMIESLENVKNNNNLEATSTQDEWIDQLKQLKSSVDDVSSFAHQFDYSSDIEYNGCRTYLKMTQGFTETVYNCFLKHLNKPSNEKITKKLNQLMGQCHALIVMGRSLCKYHLLYQKYDSDTIYSDKKFAQELLDVFIEFQESLTYENTCEYFHPKYFGPWLPQWVRTIFKRIAVQLFFSSHPLHKSLYGVFSKKTLRKYSTRWALDFQVGPFKQPTETFFRGKMFALSMWTWNKINRDIFVRYPKLTIRQTSWIIDKNSKTIKYSPENIDSSMKCEKVKTIFLQPRDHDSKDLILFFHGGAFVSMTAESIIPLLQPIVRRTRTPVLTVDYTLAPEAKFPVACQEILDVYLNLLSNDSIIGYTPEKITVAGESAGAHFALSLAISVAEIQCIEQSHHDQVTKMTRLPHSIHAIYPVSSVCVANFFPSRCLIDFLIQPSAFYPVFNAYCGPFNEDVSSPKLNYKNDPWHKDRETLGQVCNALNDQLDNPLVNPVGYKHFYRLNTVPLYVTVGEFDPLLDDSITIAKQWKGPVTLDVIPDSPHGLCTFEYFASKNFTGGKLTRQRFVQSLDPKYSA